MSSIVKHKKSDPWDRRVNETEEEYLEFMEWLQSDRPSVSGAVAQVSMANEWAERANAYDVQDALAQSPRAKFEATFNALNGVAMLEASKLLKRCAAAGQEQVLQPKEIMLLIRTMAQFTNEHEQRKQAEAAHNRDAHALETTGTTQQLDEMSDEEFEQFQRTVEMMERLKK